MLCKNVQKILQPILMGLLSCLVVQAAMAEPLKDDRPKLHNVENQMAALSAYGEWMGYWLGPDSHFTGEPVRPQPLPNETGSQHYQGIARSNGPGPTFFYVSRSGDSDFVADNLGSVDVVSMATRDWSGERLRSNRLATESETKDTTPTGLDRTVKTILYDDYWHPGGLDVIGDILAVSLEGACRANGENRCLSHYPADMPGSVVRFYDISNPANPQFLYDFQRPDDGPARADNQLGFVGLVKWKGRHLMLVPAEGDRYWQFFRTAEGVSLAEASGPDDWEFFAEFDLQNPSDTQGVAFPVPPNAFQNMHFLIQAGATPDEDQ